MENWREVWERKGTETQDYTLQSLIKADGFDKGAGKMTEEQWLRVVDTAVKELEITASDSLLEVGCGSGAMLLPLSKLCKKVSGIDYSATLVAIAQKAIPGAEIKVAEANHIPFTGGVFDKVLVHSVFQYFPDYSYAAQAMDEMLRVLRSEGAILILDVPDLATMEKSEAERNAVSGKPSAPPPAGSNPYSHQYYPRSFFTDYARAGGFKAKITSQHIPGYGNAPFRFNVTMRRQL